MAIRPGIYTDMRTSSVRANTQTCVRTCDEHEYAFVHSYVYGCACRHVHWHVYGRVHRLVACAYRDVIDLYVGLRMDLCAGM